jgi:drug/metabolite transporter (DMT)-like permease
LPALLFISFTLCAITSNIIAVTAHGIDTYAGVAALDWKGWLLLAYLAIVASGISRVVNTKAYEHIGTITAASFGYLHYILAMALPILLLGEPLSWEILVGAGFIVVGLVLTQKHHAKHLAHHKRIDHT